MALVRLKRADLLAIVLDHNAVSITKNQLGIAAEFKRVSRVLEFPTLPLFLVDFELYLHCLGQCEADLLQGYNSIGGGWISGWFCWHLGRLGHLNMLLFWGDDLHVCCFFY